MNQEKPIYNIRGTDFLVDVKNLQLVESANPENIIFVQSMKDVGNGYEFLYSDEAKNLPTFSWENTSMVKIPELVKLDPTGMAEKYNCSMQEVCAKTDFEVMVDQNTLRQRLLGTLPTVEFPGETFCVDLHLGWLRPISNPLAGEIKFEEISKYAFGDSYCIPYNPGTHQFQEPDYDSLTKVPGDLIVVSFPVEHYLDPVGCNRLGGYKETDDLKFCDLKLHFKAEKIDWEKLGVEQIIQNNIKKKQTETFDQINIGRQRKGLRL